MRASSASVSPVMAGSPEQLQVAIQLLCRSRKVTTPPANFAQRDFVGFDCNGFVGGYFQKIVRGWTGGPPTSTRIPSSRR